MLEIELTHLLTEEEIDSAKRMTSQTFGRLSEALAKKVYYKLSSMAWLQLKRLDVYGIQLLVKDYYTLNKELMDALWFVSKANNIKVYVTEDQKCNNSLVS